MKSEIIERAVKTALDESEEFVRAVKVPDLYAGFLARARQIDNPYLQDFNKLHQNPSYTKAIDVVSGRVRESFDYEKLSSAQERMMRRLTHKYAWGVPTPEALATIAEHSPIVEVGAGTGYWAHLLRSMDVDIVAIDRHGTDIKFNRFHKMAPRAWTDIVKAKAESVALDPNRALFMSFPTPGTGFANDVLNKYQGKKFLFVGEVSNRQVTGDLEFQANLARNWREVRSVQIPNWETAFGLMHDKLHVFDRI